MHTCQYLLCMAVQVYVWLLCLVCGNFVPVKRLARLNPSQLDSILQKTDWHIIYAPAQCCRARFSKRSKQCPLCEWLYRARCRVIIIIVGETSLHRSLSVSAGMSPCYSQVFYDVPSPAPIFASPCTTPLYPYHTGDREAAAAR